MSFIYGGNTGIRTPQEAARLRAVAEAMASRGRAPSNIGEGLTAIGEAIGARRAWSRANRIESEGRANWDKNYGDVLSGAFDPAPGATGGAVPADPVEVPPQPDLTQAPPEYQMGGGMLSPENAANIQLPPAAYNLGYGGEPGASAAQQAVTEQAAGQPDITTAGLSIESGSPQAPQQQPGIQQVADSGGIDPQRIIDALSDPWVPEGQKAVLQAILEQRLKEMAPVDYGITTEGGDFYRTNPRTGQVELVLDNPPEPEKPTSDMQNYEYAKQSGFEGSFDDWVNRPDPLNPTPDIQEYEYDKANGYEGTFHQWQQEKQAEPPAPYSFTTQNGDIYTQDPNTGKVTKAIDNPDKPEKPPAAVQEYEYAATHGFKGTFEEWQKLKDPLVTVQTGDIGAGDKELRKELSKKEGERWDALQEAGAVSGSMTQDFQVLDHLMTVAPQSPLTGRLVEMFPGFSTTGAAFQSIVTRLAPSLRTPGSGATSDLEYEGFLSSLPRLRNTPEANQIISEVMKGKAALNVERSDVITAYQNEEITAKEARTKLAELNKRSILSPKMKSLLSAEGTKDPKDMTDEELLKDLGVE